jgi:hypothetical protein
MRRRLAAYRLTAAGGALIFVLGAAVIVLLLGPRHDEAPALIVIVVVLFMLVVGGGTAGRPASFEQSLDDRRERFHPRRRLTEEQPDAQTEAEAWQRERQAYAERTREPEG